MALSFGIYLHWPFCAAKCPYCDFNSHVAASVDHDAWEAAYLAEVDRVAAEVGPRPVSSVFFGGGTPSLMEPGIVEAVLDRIAARFPLVADVEVTLEANPTSVESDRFAAFRAAGVNRVSVGVQALNDQDLRRLGRVHDAAEAMQAVDIAMKTFERASFDLIYARQGQSLADWRVELETALSRGMSHLSLYQLTIEEGTVFGRRQRAGRLWGLPDEDLQADMFLMTQDMMQTAGLPAYEISNHAQPGQESRHNLIYWQSGDWAGIGPGAHGRLTLEGQRWATETYLEPRAWLRAVTDLGNGESVRSILDSAARFREQLLMGLRLTAGILVAPEAPGRPDGFDRQLAALLELGLVAVDGPRLCLTAAGRPLLDSIVASLLRDY